MSSKHTINGVVRARQRSGSVVGYRVTADYKIHIGDPQAGYVVPASRSARISEDGKFALELDDGSGQPLAPIELVVAPPTGQEQLRRTLSLEDLSRTLRLRVTTPSPTELEPSDDPAKGSRVRMTGRVVDRSGATVPAGLPVVIVGAVAGGTDGGTETEQPDTTVVATTTQRSGGFSADWPSQALVSASARVAGGDPTPVRLEDGRLPRHVILVIDLDALDGDNGDGIDGASCDAAPPLAADAADLVANPEAFAQDLNGSCLDLTVPNRTVEEFTYYSAVRTTEPRITAFTIDPATPVPPELLADLLGVSIASEAIGLTQRSSVQLQQQDISMSISVANELIRSDTPPSVYQIAEAGWQGELDDTKVAIDAGLRTQSGRHRLDLDYAIDWDETPTIHLAIDIAFGHLLHFKESLKSNGYSLGRLLYSLPLAPNERRQIALLDWDRRTTSSRTEQLEYEERLDALLTRDRDIQELVSSEVSEDLSASSSNKTFGFAAGVGGGFIGPGWGVFGGVAGGYGRSASEATQSASRQFAADTLQSLQDRISQRSSSMRSQRSTVVQTVGQGERARAETEFVGNYNRCHSLTIEYFQVLRHLIVTHELAHAQECLFVPLPLDHFDDNKALRWKEVLRRHLRNRRLRGGFRAMERIADDWQGWEVPEGSYAEEPPEVVDGELRISFLIPRPRDDVDGAFQVDMWDFLAPFINTDPLELYTAKFNGETQRSRDVIFQRDVAPTVAASMIDGLRLAYVTTDGGEVEVPIDASLISKYREGEPLYVTLNPVGIPPATPRQDISHIKISYEGEPLPPDSRVIVHSGKVRYRTDSLTAVFFDRDRILDDLDIGDAVVVPAPLSQRELRNPRDEDLELATELRDHLNEHIEYYHQAIWMSLDSERRFMLLDAVIVPGTGGRSVASVCANQVVGIVGNSLVLPVSPGIRLDPTFAGTDDNGNPIPLIDAYATPPPPPVRISLPTRGVHAEAIMGACNACEELDDSRYWRWTNEGLLEVPEIESVSTGSLATDEPDLTPTDLPAPLVTIQNAPAAPDPTGLGPAFGLLSTPGLFRDVTGLEGTQQNAGAALQGAVAASSAIGDEAYKLATQNMLGQNAQRLMGQLADARDRGLLTDNAFTEIGSDLVSGLIGATMPEAPIPWLDPGLAEAAGNADSGQISASTPSEAVDITYDGSGDGSDGEGGGEYQPSAPLGLTDLVAPAAVSGVDPITYDELALAYGDGLSTYVDQGYLAGADDGSGRLLIQQHLRIVYPQSPDQPDQVAGSERRPVVVLAHGTARGWTDDPEAEPVANLDGFAALQDALADVGIITVSVDLNAVPHLEPISPYLGGALTLAAIDRLTALDLDPASVLHGRLDLDRLGVLAHSNGASAMMRAVEANVLRPKEERFTTAATCLVAPILSVSVTDISPLDTDFLLVLQPGLDGEAPTGRFIGHGYTGLGLFDLAGCEKSLVFLDGCNHRHFNEVWAGDGAVNNDTLGDVTTGVDEDRLLSAEVHRDLLIEYARALFTWRLLDDPTEAGLLDGSRLNAIQSSSSVHYSLGEHRKVVDSMDPDGAEAGERMLDEASIAGPFDINIDGVLLNDMTGHSISPLLWVPPSQRADAVYTLTTHSFDWREYDELLFRVATNFDLSSQAAIDDGRLPEFTVRAVDITGAANEFGAESVRRATLNHRPVAHTIVHVEDTVENVTTLQFRTMSIAVPVLLDGLGALERLELAPVAGFGQHLFFAQLELIRR